MNKRLFSLLTALILIATNASMAYALGPVAEVYYHVEKENFESILYETQLNEAVKTKLLEAGINPKYVTIMDASASAATVKDTTHVHSGLESWRTSSNIPEVETADYNHVQITNDGKTLAFYGYTSPAYKDFMITNGNPSGKKIITFDMDESKVDYHSMEGGGFLFNTEVDGEGILRGYAILYVQNGIQVLQIDGINVNDLHNEKSKALSNMSNVSQLGVLYPKGISKQHSIKIVIDDQKLNMWDNGELTIDGLILPKVYGNEFGPIVSHVSHSCHVISIFTFDNMTLYSTSTKTFDKAVEEIQWDPTSPLHYIVNINDEPDQKDLENFFSQYPDQYIGVHDNHNDDEDHDHGGLRNFIEGNGGTFVDSKADPSTVIEAIATLVAEQIIDRFKDAILAIESAESKVKIEFASGDTKNSVTKNLTLFPDSEGEVEDGAITVWSSNQPSVITADGTVTRPVAMQSGVYVTLTATITKDGLTSEQTFTVYVKSAEPSFKALSAVAGEEKVTLSFEGLTGVEDEKDLVVQISMDGVNFTPVSEELLETASNSATVTGLTNGETYYFYLEIKTGEIQGVSNVVKVKLPLPLTISGIPGNKQAVLSFPALTGADTKDIIVEFSTDGINFTPVTTAETLDSTSTNATVSGLTNGTTYSFRISVKSGEYTRVSNIVTVTPRAPYVPPVEHPTMDAKVIVTDQTSGGAVVQDKITKLIGDNLSVTGKIISANGQELNVPSISMNPDGSFKLPKVAPGEYSLSLNIIAPNGENLAGPKGKLIVDHNGDASLSIDLVDPYGTILDTITDLPLSGVKMSLYWADTELNRSKGRMPGTLVNLPELPDFPPNKNHNPQISTDRGEYGWMVFPDGDYYFLGEKDGYIVFDSRKDERDEKFGEDSYIRNGIIHVGDTIVQYSFNLMPKVKSEGDHKPYMLGYPDGSFKPNRGILRAEVAAILTRLYESSGNNYDVVYSDVSSTYWARDIIEKVTNNKWMVGTGNNKFQPNREVSRAEFAQILMNVYSWNMVANDSKYMDIQGHWAENAIIALEQQGLLFDFTDEMFKANEAITRLEAIRIFNKLLGRQLLHVNVEPKWNDVSVNHENYLDIMEASLPHNYVQYMNGFEVWPTLQEK